MYWESNVMLWKRLPEKKSFLYVLVTSSIWSCRILNIEYLLLFSAGRCSGKNKNNYSKNKLWHVHDELPRTLISSKSCNIFNFLGFIVNFEGTGCFIFLISRDLSFCFNIFFIEGIWFKFNFKYFLPCQSIYKGN